VSLLLALASPPAAQEPYAPDEDVPLEELPPDTVGLFASDEPFTQNFPLGLLALEADLVEDEPQPFVPEEETAYVGLSVHIQDDERLLEHADDELAVEDPPFGNIAVFVPADDREDDTLLLETFYEDELPIVVVVEELIWLADDERQHDDGDEASFVEDEGLPALVFFFDAAESIETDPLVEEPEVSPQEPLPAIVSHLDVDDGIPYEAVSEERQDEETPTSTFAPLPDEDFGADDSAAAATIEDDLNFPEDFTPAVLQPEYVLDDEVLYEEQLEEILEEESVLPDLQFGWATDDTAERQEELVFEPFEEPFIPLPEPIPPPPPPPAPPTPEPPVSAPQFGSTGGVQNVWNLGTPSKRYVNFAKRPAPRYPYDFWEKLSATPPPAPPPAPKMSSPPREIRWMQRFERTLQKDSKDTRPLYSRLLDLLRKKR
jgi:hypothetical protein